MPELPEVETIRRQLHEVLPLKIESVEYSPVAESILKKKDRHCDPVGKTIVELKRTGKLLEFQLDNGDWIFSHLGMSGSWRIWKKEDARPEIKHTHVIISGKNFWLGYVDPRRFGTMYYFTPELAAKYKKKLGVDIGSPDFTGDYVYSVLKKYPERAIKAFLLDQKYFSGCGNYIACEICALAGIRPTRKAGKITRAEADKIQQAARAVIEGQIKFQGLTFAGGYADAFGNNGGGLNNLVVFHQETCGLCKKTKVKKMVLAQRGTYYCPSCQQ